MLLRSGLVGFAFSVLLLTACGGGGSPGPAPVPTVAPTASPSPTPTPTASPSPTPTPTPSPVPAFVCPTGNAIGSAAMICKTPSTNTQGYVIVIQTSGSAAITENGNTTSGMVSSSVTTQLFNDLTANSPVVDVKTYAPCTKPASFATMTTLTYMTYTTGDVSCPSGASSPTPSDMLNTDAQNVESALGLH